MGLRALAYYLDRSEAEVVRSVLSGAGILAIVGNEDMLRAFPNYTLAIGGYRILVSDLDLEDAIAVLAQARAEPVVEGGTLLVSADLLDRALGLFIGWLAGGAPCAIKERSWRETAS
jgi:hypothetical protein